MPRASVVVPIYNGRSYLPAFFASLAAALPERSEVVLIDDGSEERVFDLVPELPHADQVIQLRNDVNVGYSAAVNRAFAHCTGDITVQLNTDLVLDRACITAMIDLVEREHHVGIVGSRLLYPTSGRVQHVGMTFGDYSTRHVYHGISAQHPLACQTRRVQIMTGATVTMPSRVLQTLGPLDERHYNAREDLDHCLRAVHAGLRNFVCADSEAYHWESMSGPARFVRHDASDAHFWATWAGRFSVDLDHFLDAALDHVLDVDPALADTSFDVLDVSRGADQSIVLDRLIARWPGIQDRVRAHRQMSNASTQIALPLVMPHWVVDEPIPFIYLVDHHRELEENAMWFARRRRVTDVELVVDLHGSVLRTSELAARAS